MTRRRRQTAHRASHGSFAYFLTMTIALGLRGVCLTLSSAPTRHSTHRNMAVMIGAPVRLVVRAAKHVNPKATKGHTKTRPIKVRLPADRPPKPWNPENMEGRRPKP